MKNEWLKWGLIALLISLSGFACTTRTPDGTQVTLKFIETSDVHGAIFPYDFINDRQATASLAQVHTYVEQERRQKGQSVVFLDAGDNLQGQPPVYYYNFERTDVPHLQARVMNYMRYDAAVVGNHDIEPGHAVYDQFVQALNMPWLAANALRPNGSPYFPPYAVIEREGVRIAVLGLITPGIPNWLPPTIWEGMTFEDMIESARKWVPRILERERPDLLVGLFHAGVDYTYDNQTAETPRNENASRLVAEQVPGFDIIFVGHDHAGWNFNVTNPEGEQVLIVGPASGARNVATATVTLTYDSDARDWRKAIAGELVDISTFAPDSSFIEEFATAFDEVKAWVSRPIGTFTETISTRPALFGNSEFVDLIHRIQLDLSDADVSFSSPLSFDAEIQAGQVYVRDMFDLYKYENLLYTMSLSGAEIDGFLEYSYGNWFNRMQSRRDHLLNFKSDGDSVAANGRFALATPTFNYDSAAGIDYIVDVSQPAGERVDITGFSDGRAFEEAAMYRVAVNSYRGNGGGHLTIGAGIEKEELSRRLLTSTEKDLRFYLMKWIEAQGTVTPKAYGNWQVVPEALWQAGRDRDYALLFPEE